MDLFRLWFIHLEDTIEANKYIQTALRQQIAWLVDIQIRSCAYMHSALEFSQQI